MKSATAVSAAVLRVERAEAALAWAVWQMRADGASWADVAKALGTSRQAAWKRYGQPLGDEAPPRNFQPEAQA